MNLGIVGTSRLTQKEAELASSVIKKEINEISPDFVISGGAKGIDSLAIEIAKDLGIAYIIHNPRGQAWEYYKERNIIIAKQSDQVICISFKTSEPDCYHHTPKSPHRKTAGCWTMNYARKLGRKIKLIVI